MADSQAPTSQRDPRRHQAADRRRARATPRSVRRTSTTTARTILLAPQGSGISLIVWVLPVVVLVARRHRHRVRVAAQPRRAAAPRDRRRRAAAWNGHARADELTALDPDRRRGSSRTSATSCMRSLDDLELEHESGGIDDESYAELHDDYTARAAAVDPDAARRRRRHAGAGAAARRHGASASRSLLVAGVACSRCSPACRWPYALGARLPGQTASGNSQAAPSTTNASQKAAAGAGSRTSRPR